MKGLEAGAPRAEVFQAFLSEIGGDPTLVVFEDAQGAIGFRLEPRIVAEVVGADADALDECISTGMLRTQDTILALRHELAREAMRLGLVRDHAATAGADE
jgi:hypothetical protein